MNRRKSMFKNPLVSRSCGICDNHVSETEPQQTAMQLSTKGCNWRALLAIPGVVLLFFIGPVFVYFMRVNGGDRPPDVWLLIWLCAITMTSCAVALLGAMVLAYCKTPSGRTGSRVTVALVRVFSVCLIVFGLILLFGNKLDLWRYLDPLLLVFSFITLGISQGAIAAVKWDLLKGNRGIWKMLSVAATVPAHVLAILLILLMLTVRFGTG